MRCAMKPLILLTFLSVVVLHTTKVRGTDEPALVLENAVISARIPSFDIKIFVATDTSLVPMFTIGIAWDPAKVDLTEVNFGGTVFESEPPAFWDDEHSLNIKPEGQPVAGIYQAILCDPCSPMIPPGPRVPILNLHFTRLDGFTGDTSTTIRFTRPPGPETNPDLELETQIWMDGEWQVIPTSDGIVAAVQAVPFARGDSNADGRVDLSDAIATLGFLFLGDSEPTCLDSADANGDARLDISDAVYSLGFLFLGGQEFPPPFPECGISTDGLWCGRYPPCE